MRLIPFRRGLTYAFVALLISSVFIVAIWWTKWTNSRTSIQLAFVSLQQSRAAFVAPPDLSSIRPIRVNDSQAVEYVLGGRVFASRVGLEHIKVNASTSLIHSFSPYTENRFRSMMIDPPKEHRIYANSPAIVWHQGRLLVAMRIWLEKERDGWIPQKPKNTFSDNYFYAQTFDDELQPLDQGHVVGIPTPIQWSIGDGPIEPRAVVVNGTLYLTLNTGVMLADGRAIDSTFLWNYDANDAILPNILGGAPMQKLAPPNEMPRDKHWSAFVISGQLHFAYNFDPLRILRCSPSSGNCSFVHFDGPENYRFGDSADVLRGGTPLVQYLNTSFFVTVVHVTLFKNCPQNNECHWKRYYTANLLVLRSHPIYRVVYCSEPLRFHEGFLKNVPIVRSRYIKDPFVFPVGLILEDANTLAIGAHVNDHSSFIFRFRGLKTIMDRLIRLDGNGLGGSPELGALHKWARIAAQRHSGYSFIE